MFIKKTGIRPFVEYLAWKYDGRVYVPDGVRFAKFPCRIKDGAKTRPRIDLDNKTLFSAKKLFLPPKETLFEFEAKGGSGPAPNKPKFDTDNIVLFGVRPCDISAIKYMDMVFADDPYYMARRRGMVIIGIQCPGPMRFENCYCHYTGTLFAEKYDLLLVPSTRMHDTGYLARAGTIRGEGMLATKHFSYKPMEDTFEKAMARVQKALDKAVGSKANTNMGTGSGKTNGPRLMAEGPINENEIRKMAKDCYSCTACTSACPTCHSFLVEDELNIDRKSGSRVRKWDSCQLKRYTRVAGDTIFRPTREQRVRQRIMCKFRYSQEDQGMMACTGCGRCVDVCNKKIDIFRVFGKPDKPRKQARARPRARAGGKRK